MKINYNTLLVVLSLTPLGTMAQTVNKGQLYVKAGSLLSTHYDFENKAKADFKNNGTFMVHKHLTNEGSFDYKGITPEGKTILMGKTTQVIVGDSLTKFNDLVLDNATEKMAFDIQNNMIVAGKADFLNGIGKVDKNKGAVTFLDKAEAANPSDKSHLEGAVEKEGKSDFTFPIGDQGMYRPAGTSMVKSNKDIFSAEYIYKDKPFFDERTKKAGVIQLVDNMEYWIIKKRDNKQENAIVTLSYDKRTTPAELLLEADKNLRIVRWNEKDKMWVDEGGIVDEANQTVTTPIAVEDVGYFTLATVKTDWMLDGEVVIYNFVSVNGTGHNEFFRIDNLHKYPDNRVEIYNRWGVKVYETTNYNSNGNVFKGYSEGRVTMNKNEKLPSGTYYFVVTYEYPDKSTGASRRIKKTGYLHLESN